MATNPGGSRTVAFGPGTRDLVLFVVEDTTRSVVWLWQITAMPDIDLSSIDGPLKNGPTDRLR